jgi:hypothetical protein
MLERDDAFKTQIGGGAIECGDTHRVIEDIVQETQMRGLGRNLEARLDEPQVMAFPGPEHHAMLAQRYWFRVTVSRDMPYSEEAHLKKWASMN